MSMQEKIIETAKEWYPATSSTPQSLCHRAGFIAGGQWATEFLVEKACEIYKKHLIKFNPTLKEFPTSLDEAVNIFRKQLEE